MTYEVVAEYGLMAMGLGQRFRRGQRIGRGSVPDDMLEAWLEDGVVEPVEGNPDTPIEAAPPLDLDDLTQLSGITEERQVSLRAMGVTSLAAVAGADDDALTRIDGIGPKRATEMRQTARDLLEAR